jgi:hypothetical protein
MHGLESDDTVYSGGGSDDIVACLLKAKAHCQAKARQVRLHDSNDIMQQ